MKYFGILLLAIVPILGYAQISGVVATFENGKKVPLPGANVFWQGTEIGTVTDKDGKYSIEKISGTNTLVVSFIGYKPQSKIVISRQGTINFTLLPEGSELTEVDVVGRVDATTVDLRRSELTFKIDDKELRKAACCNLSESFETNASVDVAFTDAVTGQRQIEMLGLAGKYALIQRENIPYARGLNASTGLTYIPGPFVESLQLTKGLSSVLNGYESMTGQINVEFYKPETAPKFYFNLFGNQGGRLEANAISGLKVSDKISTSVMAHASTIPFAQDGNNDGFADIPTGNQLNFTNRWHWHEKDGWEGQIGFNAIRDEKNGGQVDFINEENQADSPWGYESLGQRYELFGKNGYVFKDKPYRSLGIIYSLSYQDRTASFGYMREAGTGNALSRNYEGTQKNGYLNTIFQDIIGNTQHTYRTGLSLLAENVNEDMALASGADQDSVLYSHSRNEIAPGAFLEYTYEPDLNFTLVAGVRADYNTFFNQVFFTPRINLRYMPGELTTLRLGGGRGQRTANVISENLNVLASSRNLLYGNKLNQLPEIGWNTGASISQVIPVGEKKATLVVDAFYTWFENKLVADLDVDPNTAIFFMTEGSRSFSLLGQVDYELVKNLELRLAYKYLNSMDRFTQGLDQSYLIPNHRAFTNLAYRTKNLWKFDLTLNWFGEKRLPSTEASPAEFRQPQHSPDFFTVNAQINKEFKNGLEIYAGVDNLLNYKQDKPIVNSEDPYAPYFDTNFTWGPIFGRNIYVGLYYTLGKK